MLIRGSLFIHSCPAALKHHVEWSIQSILGKGISLSWRTQPMAAGTYRSEISWHEKKSKASEIATALRSWHYLRFEVRDESESGGDFYRFTPDLGIHRASIDGAGSILINENQITAALDKSFDEEALRTALESALGTKWELELEPLRAVDMQERSHLQAI
jgi:hypothetical protein